MVRLRIVLPDASKFEKFLDDFSSFYYSHEKTVKFLFFIFGSILFLYIFGGIINAVSVSVSTISAANTNTTMSDPFNILSTTLPLLITISILFMIARVILNIFGS